MQTHRSCGRIEKKYYKRDPSHDKEEKEAEKLQQDELVKQKQPILDYKTVRGIAMGLIAKPVVQGINSLHRQNTSRYRSVKIHSAYLGLINVDVYDLGRGYVALQTIVKGLRGEPDVFVKELDSVRHRLKPDRYNYTMNYLSRLQPTVVNLNICKKHYLNIERLEKKKKTGALSMSEQKSLHSSYIHNIPVDIHFNTCQYLDFLHTKLKINNVINTNVLLSIHNIRNLDNAFFTGEFMVYGNGDKMFYPLGTSDVGGHELGHGLVQSSAGLKYQGHSGALNESFSDVLGVSFEFYLYKKFNENKLKTDDLKGEADWVIGEDSGKSIEYLRNMKDPNNAKYPQPKIYRGKYWADPNGQMDYGGVHINSGVGNYCFYLLSSKIGKDNALSIFYNCLKSLGSNSSYIDFRNGLLECAGREFMKDTQLSLKEVGLTIKEKSDWTPLP